MSQGRGQDRVRIGEGGVPADRQARALRGLVEALRPEMRPRFNDPPDYHQEIARTQPYRFLDSLDRQIVLTAERVDDADISMREAGVGVQLDRAPQPPHGLV